MVTLAVVVGWARVVMEMAVVEGRVGEAVGLEVEGAAAGRRAMVVLQAAAVVACEAPGAEALVMALSAARRGGRTEGMGAVLTEAGVQEVAARAVGLVAVKGSAMVG